MHKLQIHRIQKKFRSYNGVNYVVCKECGCHYQDPIIKINYSDSFWQDAVDPDGIKRKFTEERDDRIKNWYGTSINLINKNRNIKVLDVGCGLGFF